LADGIYLHIAALVTFHGETNGYVLGQAQKRGLIGAFGWNLLRDSRECLRESEAGAARQCGDARLERGGCCVGVNV